MKKISFEDLRYLVLEGGGARGAAYLGAIRGLEEEMEDRVVGDKSTIFKNTSLENRAPGLLDYYRREAGKESLAIEGIAGASAGAITAFALALGLNSEEIGQVLDYPFKNFLDGVHAGKYRTVDKKNKLGIGEDTRNKVTGAKELHTKENFEFQLDKNQTLVRSNFLKLNGRRILIDLVLKIILDGVAVNLKALVRLFDDLRNQNATSPIGQALVNWAVRAGSFGPGLLATKAIQAIVFKFLKIGGNINIDADGIGNLLYDRGLFSGFAVREFFLDLLLFALTRDTAFHRGFIRHLSDVGSDFLKSKAETIRKGLLALGSFRIGQRSKSYDALKGIDIEKWEHYLMKLTFDEFKKMVDLRFAVCVSNFTTGMPLYFSAEYTPNFLVMEAVAASMTIPPAIKPLYNEGNVINIDTKQFGNIPFEREDGSFDLSDYYIYEYAVKKALAQEMGKSEEKPVFIDLNNSIDLSAFLIPLRDRLLNKKFKGYQKSVTLDSPVGSIVEINVSTFAFFYNAAYKGMLIDGGYRNNIPYNFFRAENDIDLPGVLALKLDDSFPVDLMEKVYFTVVKKYIPILNELRKQSMDDSIYEEPLSFELDKAFALIRKEVEVIYSQHADLAKKSDKAALNKLIVSSIAKFEKVYLSPPWAIPKNILSLASAGYEYGTEKGQIRSITDHNHILPLYDYGIGVYDFDLEKVQPQVKLAQAKAKEAIHNYFK